MLDVLFLYSSELDTSAIDAHLAEHLVPEFSKAHGLRSLHVSDGTLMSREVRRHTPECSKPASIRWPIGWRSWTP